MTLEEMLIWLDNGRKLCFHLHQKMCQLDTARTVSQGPNRRQLGQGYMSHIP
jgi:hypothetical protein